MSKVKVFIKRIIRQSRNTLASVQAILYQHSKDDNFQAEYKKIQYLANKAVGIDVTGGSEGRVLSANLLDQSIDRGHDGSSTDPSGMATKPLTDQQILEVVNVKLQAEAKLASLEATDTVSEDAKRKVQEQQDIIRQAEQQLLEGMAFEKDEFGVEKFTRITVENSLIAASEEINGRKAIDFDDALLYEGDPSVVLSILFHRIKQNQGAEFKSANKLGKVANTIGMDPAQMNMTHDSKFNIVRTLSNVIDAEGILTSHVMSDGNKGISDLITANKRIRDEFALIRGRISQEFGGGTSQDIFLVTEFLANPNKEAKTDIEKSAKDIAKVLGQQLDFVVERGKKSGFIYHGIDYSVVPLKRSNDIQNMYEVLNSLGKRIGNRVVSQANNIDPLTLSISGLLPQIYNTSLNSLGKSNSRAFDTDRFVADIMKLKQVAPEVLDSIIGMTRKEFALDRENNIHRLTAEDITAETSVVDLAKLEFGLYTLYQQGYKKHSITDKAIVDFVNKTENRKIYDATVFNDLSTNQQTILRRYQNVKAFKIGKIQTIVEDQTDMFKGINNLATFRAKLFMAEVGQGARFLAADRAFDPDPNELLLESMGKVNTGPDGRSPLQDVFVFDPIKLMDSVATGLAFDAEASESFAKMTSEEGKPPIIGVRFDRVIQHVKTLLQTAELADTTTRSDETTLQELNTHLDVLMMKYNTLAGRQQRVDNTQSGSINNRIASVAKDLVLALYGGNLTIATSVVEGTMTGLSMMGRGDAIMGPANLIKDIFAGAVKGTASGFSTAIKGTTGIDLGNPLAVKQTAAELSYAHEHALIQGIERESDNDSLVGKGVMDRVARAIGLARDVSTSAAMGVQNNIKFHVEGLAIYTLNNLIRSGALKRLSNVLASKEGKAILAENMESMDNKMMRDKFDRLVKLAGLSDFNFLRGNLYRVVFDLQASGLLSESFESDLNELIQESGLSVMTHDKATGRYDAKESALSHIGTLQATALAQQDPAKREKFMQVIANIKRFINKELDARFVGGNPMVSDTTNSAFSVLLKLFKSYPTNFFAQRMRRDSRFYNPMANTVRIMSLMAHDIGYMVLMEIAKSGFEEKRLDLMLKELQQKEAMMRLISRTPTFGLVGGLISNFFVESFIQITTGKGFTGNILNQAFIPVPMQKLQSLMNNVLRAARYQLSDADDAEARRNLALFNILQSVPLLQEYFVRAAIGMYMPESAQDMALQQMKRQSFQETGSGSKSGNRKSANRPYFEDGGMSYKNNPFDPQFATERNIHPINLMPTDELATLFNMPLPNRTAAAEALPPQEGSTPPEAPEAPTEAPRPPMEKPASPAVPTAKGDTPSERFAESL